MAGLIGLAIGAALFLALAVWQPLVDVWSCLPSGAAEQAFGEWELLQVNRTPKPKIINPKPYTLVPTPNTMNPDP